MANTDRTSKRASIAISPRIVFTLLILTGGAALPLQAQTESTDRQTPAVTHNTWTSGTALPTAVWHTAAAVLKNEIYVVGGVNSDDTVIADVQIYNPVTNTWSVGVPFPTTICCASAAVVKNVLYVMGGSIDGTTRISAVWAFNPKKQTWSSMNPMPTTAADAGVAVEKDIIYIVGGNSTEMLRSNAVQAYDPATDTWTEEATLLDGKSEPSVGLIGTTIVAADGVDNNGTTGNNEGYDATTNTWSSLASDPTPRSTACAGSIGAKLYVAGGYNGSDLTLNESFQLSKNTWKTLAPIPQTTLFSRDSSTVSAVRPVLTGPFSTICRFISRNSGICECPILACFSRRGGISRNCPAWDFSQDFA